MSLNQKGAQSKKPLGDGKTTESSSTNRILYGLLVILIIVFIWKISSQENQVVDIGIPEDKTSDPHLFLDDDTKELNPNIEVEIEEAEGPIAKVETKIQTTSPRTEVYESGTSIKGDTPTHQVYTGRRENQKAEAEKAQSSSPNQYIKNTKVVESNNSNYDSYNNLSYIYTGEVEMPQGTYRGLDKDGFARTNMIVDEGTLHSNNYAEINLAPIFEDQLGVSSTTYQLSDVEPSNVVSKLGKRIVDVVATKERKKYPSTGIPYGEDAYPLKDTLPWHPYESLAYMREEKEVFVAEKVRAMPTADDLEPNIHPSTLGDRDTRMGFGVVIRPGK